MGPFICCVSNSHLESRIDPQMPGTQFAVFLNVNVFQDDKQAMISKHSIWEQKENKQGCIKRKTENLSI